MRLKIIVTLITATPVALLAFSTGPPARRTGAPVDGGVTCTACHVSFAPANSDPRGRVRIEAVNYTPGVKQTVRVTVSHPEASRWGFQITARLASDPTKQAGTFAVNDEVRVRCDVTPAQDAPCNGAVEFPEHKNAPRSDPGAGHTFQIEWTPPATDVGDVIFYAAGNAADGGGTPLNDRIYTTSRTISTCGLTQKPAITNIVNAGSFQPGFAPNTMITIFGSGFASTGESRQAGSGDMLDNGSFPTQSLGCVAVEVGGKRVPVTFVNPTQINFEAPTTNATGTTPVRVIVNADQSNQVTSDATNVTMASVSPSFFTFGTSKSIAALFGGTAKIVADPSLVTGATAAKPGDIVSLFGTGFGFTDPIWQSGEVPTGTARLISPYTITIGGTTLSASDVLYAGLSPQSISGLYQFDVRLPTTLSNGNVPVVIQVGSARTQDGATIPISR